MSNALQCRKQVVRQQLHGNTLVQKIQDWFGQKYKYFKELPVFQHLRASYSPVSLLSSSIPNLSFDCFIINFYTPRTHQKNLNWLIIDTGMRLCGSSEMGVSPKKRNIKMNDKSI